MLTSHVYLRSPLPSLRRLPLAEPPPFCFCQLPRGPSATSRRGRANEPTNERWSRAGSNEMLARAHEGMAWRPWPRQEN
eukprot:4569611-Pyramimonas_sp.AAC.1